MHRNVVMPYKTKTLFLCRSLAGVIFIVSAILKFLSVDSFELYIYGLDWFSLAVSSFLARALLFAEMSLGICLLIGLYGRLASRLSSALLLLFTVFLIYLATTGQGDNCHCFGDFVEMDPLESMGKNVLLGVFIFLGWNLEDWRASWRPALLTVVLVGSLVFAFVIKAPYGFGMKNVGYSSDDYAQLVSQHPELKGNGKKILAFVSTGCKHCKMASRKLNIALHRAGVSLEPVHWFVIGDSVRFQTFLEETEVVPFRYDFLPPRDFLKITQGTLPLILLTEDGKVSKVMSNATFNENDIVKFVKE